MRIAVINCPNTSVFYPPMALPSLAAHLRRAGHDVLQVDASIELQHELLREEELDQLSKRILRLIDDGRLRVEESDGSGMGWLNEPGAASRVRRLVDESASILRRGISLEGFENELQTLDQTLRLRNVDPESVSRTGLGFYAPRPRKSFDDPRSPLGGYVTRCLTPTLQQFKPDLIGFSVCFSTQLPVLEHLMRLLRVGGFQQPFVTGGTAIGELLTAHFQSEGWSQDEPRRFAVRQPATTFVDPFAIWGQGETPLTSLCDELESGSIQLRRDDDGDWQFESGDLEIRSLLVRRRDELEFCGRQAPMNGASMAVPDLAGLPVENRYLSPIRIAPLMTSLGCYWNKCTYCGHTAHHENSFRRIPHETVLETFRTYGEDFGVRAILLVDEAIPPAAVKALTESLPTLKNEFRIATMARFERALEGKLGAMADVGLRMLMFGLESASPCVLEKMDKGYDLDVAQRLIDECADSGIAAHCFVMFGFPGEQPADAEQTVSFLQRNAGKLEMVRAQPWYLDSASAVARNPEAFGVEVAADGSYRVREGLNAEESEAYVERVNADPRWSSVSSAWHMEDFVFIQGLVKEELSATKV